MQKIKFYFLWLALIAIIAFSLQVMIPNFTKIFVLNSKLYSGEIWRALTPIFLHGSLRHLVSNLFALVFFGFLLEKTIGSKRFLFVFLTTGILANLISVNFYNSSLGASGAIMGIIGTLTFLRPRMYVWAFGFPLPLFLASIFWVIIDYIGIFVPDGVGNIAHLSGIGFGLLIGFYYRKKFVRRRARRDEIHIPEDVARNWEMTYLVRR